MSQIYDLSVDELLKGDATLMQKIENDSRRAKEEKKLFRSAWIALAVSLVLFILGYIFPNNPVLDFINGALPWVLLGLLILYTYLRPQNDSANPEGTAERKQG